MEVQQQNPIEEHQIGPNNDNSSVADTKPFSLRQYALASRQKDIIRSWPFPVKYLEICLKHGIKNVLPPFETHEPATPLIGQCVRLNCAQDDEEGAKSDENEGMPSKEQASTEDEHDSYLGKLRSKVPQDDQFKPFNGSGSRCNNEARNHLSSDTASGVDVPIYQTFNFMPRSHLIDESYVSQTSAKRLGHKRKKRNQKLKKRLMTDILAVAKHCSLGDPYRNQILSSSISIKFDDDWSTERCGRMACLEHDCESEIKECPNKEQQEDFHSEEDMTTCCSKEDRH